MPDQSRSPRAGRLRDRPLGLFIQTAGTRIVGMLSSALLVVLLSRQLDPTQYGIYALFSTTYVFGNLVLGLGLSGNLSARVPGRDDREAARLLGTFFLAEVGIGGVIVAVSLVAGLDRWLARALDVGPYLSALRLLFLFIWIDLGTGSCLNYLLARKRFGPANLLTLLRGNMLAPLLGVVWLWRGSFGVTTIAAAWLVTGAGALVFGVVATGLPGAVRGGFDGRALRGAIPFGLMLASQSVAFYFLKLADRYFLARFVTLAEVGLYSFAYTISNIAYALSALVLVGLFQPHIVEAHNQGDSAKRDRLLGQLTRTAMAAVIVGAVLAALLSRQVLFFARPAYASSAPIIPWLMTCLLPVVAAYPATIMLMLEKKLWASAVGGAAAIGVAALLDFLLIPRFSYRGALVASFVGFTILALIQHAVAGTWRFLAPAHFRALPADLRSLLRSRSGR